MKRPRISIVKTACRRCGKVLCTASRSIWGADMLKAKYESTCEACMTDDEKKEMLRQLGEHVANVCRASL